MDVNVTKISNTSTILIGKAIRWGSIFTKRLFKGTDCACQSYYGLDDNCVSLTIY